MSGKNEKAAKVFASEGVWNIRSFKQFFANQQSSSYLTSPPTVIAGSPYDW